MNAISDSSAAMPALLSSEIDGGEGFQEPPRFSKNLRIAVLVPCLNEAASISVVVQEFRSALPTAIVYVYDNNSIDETIALARAAGAIVRRETRQGKGNVVRRMFADIEADIYVLVDGDGTYDAAAAPGLVHRLIQDKLDFVNAQRVSSIAGAYRRGHRFGNRLLTQLIALIFGQGFSDMLSGYKILSRRLAKSFPALSSGFETETELAVHALELRLACAEVPTVYRERVAGSQSKLRTYRDGFRILMTIVRLVKDERPLQFFGCLGLGLVLVALLLFIPILITYVETGLVPRLPTAVLSLGLVLAGMLTIFAGLILDMTTRMRQELKRLLYLSAVNIDKSETST